MRLTLIEKPKSLLLKLAYFLSKKQFGKVLSVFKIIYARSTPIMMASLKIINTEKKLSISKEVRTLIRYYTSHLNECSFCSNLNDYAAAKDNIEFNTWKEFLNFRESEKFTSGEKALLCYLEGINFTKSATDETFSELKKHFTEKEIVEITWVNSTENYFNLMAKPLGLSSDDLKFQKENHNN